MNDFQTMNFGSPHTLDRLVCGNLTAFLEKIGKGKNKRRLREIVIICKAKSEDKERERERESWDYLIDFIR